MHEMSIAEAILKLALHHTRGIAALRCVHMRAGALRGIDPQAMAWAWEATTRGTIADGSQLKLELLPWQMRCSSCGRQFSATDPFSRCTCGCAMVHPIGGDELQVTSIDVDDHVELTSATGQGMI